MLPLYDEANRASTEEPPLLRNRVPFPPRVLNIPHPCCSVLAILPSGQVAPLMVLIHSHCLDFFLLGVC